MNVKQAIGRRLLLLWMLVMVLVPLGAASAAAQDATPGATPQASPQAAPVTASGLEGATQWLLGQQADDGGFIGFSGESDAGTTVDAVVSLVVAGEAGVDTGTAIDDALSYLASEDVALVYAQTGVGQAAKLALSLIATGQDPHAFADVDPLAIVERGQDEETGIYGAGIFDHAYAILALSAAGVEVPQSSFDALSSTQSENGGWAFDASTDPAMTDSNTTAMVVQALVAAGQGESELMTGAVAYLESAITSSGAVYAVNEGAIADGNSTALVLQALIAVGDDNTSTLANALATFQGQNGAFFYQTMDMTDNLFTTLQAIPALAERPLPIVPAPQAAAWLNAA